MDYVTISNELDGRARMRDIEAEAKAEELAREQAKKNKNFTQVYPMGWEAFDRLIDDNPQACKLYMFLTRHIDSQIGAVVATQEFLAEQMGTHKRTIQRWLDVIENKHHMLIKIPIHGRVYAYCLDPLLVWKGWDNSKTYAAFNAKTLTNKTGEIARNLKILALKQKGAVQAELPLMDEEKSEEIDRMQ